MISGGPGDDPSVIASGPTVPDPTTSAAAIAILENYRIEIPASVRKPLPESSAETPKPGDIRFRNVTNHVVATPQDALEAAAEVARDAGFRPLILGNAIEGEAREGGLVHAGIAKQAAGYGQPAEPPCVLISGGETTVTVRGGGRGGRNVEFLLSLAAALEGHARVAAIAPDTGGIDGSAGNAGSSLLPHSPERAVQARLTLPAHPPHHD